MRFEGFLRTLTRKKERNEIETRLSKYLSTFDLVSIGVGSTIGFGVFVLSGIVSKYYAGPSAIFSFAIAALASGLAGLCFSEFGTRIPRAGSSYAYAVTILGELAAFLIGWNLIQEYAIASASVAKAVSGYIDAVSDNATSQFFQRLLPLEAEFLDEYVDVIAFGVVMIISISLAFGAKESAVVNSFFAVIKLLIFFFILVVACFKFDISNWQIPAELIPQDFGTGGFFPYGVFGVLKGAALCFSAFAGFETVLSAAEEAYNPKKSIPISIFWTLLSCFLVYVSITTCLTLMVPYYELDVTAPLSRIFHNIGWNRTFQIITTGSLFGLLCTLISSFFALPRIFFAMAEDGLLFGIFGRVHPKFKTPVWGILFAGFLTGTIAAIFKVKHLLSFLSVGSLISHTSVAICVILIRYEVANEDNVRDRRIGLLNIVFNVSQVTFPTKLTTKLVTILVSVFTCLCFVISTLLTLLGKNFVEINFLTISPLVVLISGVFIVLFALSTQPISQEISPFSVPCVPWIPAISIMLNAFLLVQLGHKALIRFAVGIVTAVVFYFAYSRRKSKIAGALNPDLATPCIPIDQEVLF